MNTIIIDIGMGNLRSIQHKLKKIQLDAMISSRSEDIEKADILFLPGVGHFAKGMENLSALNLLPTLNRKVLEEKTPIMGICMGMQLFAKHSEEGNAEGLGWLDAKVKLFKFDSVNPKSSSCSSQSPLRQGFEGRQPEIPSAHPPIGGQLRGAGRNPKSKILSSSSKSEIRNPKSEIPNLRVPHIGWNYLQWPNGIPESSQIEPDQKFYFIHSYYMKCENFKDVLTTSAYGLEFASTIRKGNIFGTQFHPEKSHLEGMRIIQYFIETIAS